MTNKKGLAVEFVEDLKQVFDKHNVTSLKAAHPDFSVGYKDGEFLMYGAEVKFDPPPQHDE